MINKEHGVYYLCCDVCRKEESSRFGEFYDALVYKIQNGWKSQKHKGEWEDVCPKCQESEVEEGCQ